MFQSSLHLLNSNLQLEKHRENQVVIDWVGKIALNHKKIYSALVYAYIDSQFMVFELGVSNNQIIL